MARSLKVVAAKKESLFAQIQSVFDLTQKISDKTIMQELLIKAPSVSSIRQEFLNTLDLFNELSVQEDDSFMPNFSTAAVVNDLVARINYTVASIEAKQHAAKLKTEASASASPQSSLRLPKLELKRFNGDPFDWISFKNLFDSTIHKNTSLSAVTKLQYLLSVLSGEPLNLINSLPLSEANYQVAYDILMERYHSPRRLLSLHLNRILDLPNINYTSDQMRNFVTSYTENTQALKGLKIDITSNNPLLSAMILRKLDPSILKKLEQSRDNNSTLATPAEIINFLSQKCNELEHATLHFSASNKPNLEVPNSSRFSKGKQLMSRTQVIRKGTSIVTCSSVNDTFADKMHPLCFLCKGRDHKIYSCSKFKAKSPADRFQIVKTHTRCISCLGAHNVKDCKSKSTCSKCHKKHHTLLHFDNTHLPLPFKPSVTTDQSVTEAGPSPISMTSQATNFASQNTTVLLGTLLVKLFSPNGTTHVFRALVDSGSQSSFISEQVAQLMGVSRTRSNHNIVGLSQTLTRSKGMTSLGVQTLCGKVIVAKHNFLILDKICVDLPRTHIDASVLNRVQSYTLADPTFHLPGRIDVLLGGALFPLMLTQANHTLGSDMPCLIGTHFGFMVMGEAPCLPNCETELNASMSTTLLTVNDIDLHKSLQKFWQQEELPSISKLSQHDQACEDHYIATHARDNSGRYCVRLPFKEDKPSLGTSRGTAEARLKSLEQKFSSQLHFKQLYSEFMSDYLISGHMELAPNIDLSSPHYFLPHHGVLKESSNTTRLRTVFDASAKTSNGFSLNDTLYTGKKMQTNICDLLLTFRYYNVVFTCDIRQMYRQIKVHLDDQPYQLILWRDNADQPISTYKLTTVTYGVSCSPYLAIRTLHQLASDEGASFPQAAEVLRTQTFVDDIIAGGDSIDKASQVKSQLVSLLQRGGFELRKWTTNAAELLQDLPDGHLETPTFLQDPAQPHFKILGLHWSSSSDKFSYNLHLPQTSKTKRQLLSVIAQIYDPCGFLSPVVMWAKCFMQLLWAKGLDWDQDLPPELLTQWRTFVNTSYCLKNIIIPRALTISHDCNVELHGFCDASQLGYSAVIYFRCQYTDNSVITRQIISKTRVAPLRQLTIPRLELNSAHLLAHLTAYVMSVYKGKFNFSNVSLWCDSTVVLTWLQTPPYRLKTFVANRVAQIQELIPSNYWKHILSEQNPADCASRGLLPLDLVNHPLWWHGTPWLTQAHDTWPAPKFTPLKLEDTSENKAFSPLSLVSTVHSEWELLRKYSSFSRLQRVMAYLLRFIHNSRHSGRTVGPLTTMELNAARVRIFKLLQASSFVEDLKALENTPPKPASSRLRRLSPFIDSDGILRVGGRLSAAPLPYEAQHPVILPKKHPVVDALIDLYHRKYLHSGVQLTQSLLAQDVWILCARSVIRSRVFQCMVCFRHKPRNKNPLMGNLPQSRLIPTRPFLNTGIDYGGPFTLKVHNLRSVRVIKAYICVFVCLVTKAVHIEVVTDLSTDAFIASLTRFVSRRGLCQNIYSDCGTNFVGADNTLRSILKTKGQDLICEFSSQRGINFHFNPPAAPHQGGLWESAIKSAKHHLRRVIGDHVLTLSEFMTLTTQVESILNSRPLTPLSTDPSDLGALTPGHFLIGSPLVAIPEVNLTEVPNNRLKHWRLVQAFHQRLWKRWQLEYLHTLQQRNKWTATTENLREGDLVLVNQPTPPISWPLARVTQVFPGPDSVVRVVHLKTQNGVLTRPSHKVFPLPLGEE